MDILSKLNKEQKDAVLQTDGPIIILAGAGSGKTRVLVYKVLYLIIKKGISPFNILMSTFTNKAAGEMLSRITKYLQKQNMNISGKNLPTVGTFHALCAKILRRHGKYIGIPINFLIYDTQDQADVIKQAMKMLDIPIKEIKPRSVLGTISSAKNEMIDPQAYASFARGDFQQAVAKIYPIYQNLLKENNALDFDDLLLETIRLFKKEADVLTLYQENFKYILVDEYQDTNKPQYVITKLLSQKNKNVCVVGDFSQSIYSFRGADFRNLEKFKKDFLQAKVFSLSQNYRSSQKILDAAYSVISNNKTHPILSLWTANGEGQDLTIFEAQSEHQETEYIIGRILEEKMNNPSLSYSDFAILYRINAQSRVVEETLLHFAIPYVLVGGTRFYERREVKDILALLSYLYNQNNNVAIKRISTFGKRKLEAFLTYVAEFNTKKYLENKNTIEIMDEAVDKTNYLSQYSKDDPEDKSRIENIKELRSVAIEFPVLSQFLENVALVEQDSLPDLATRPLAPERSDGGRITLMTLHAAKGLEFKNVFMIGMEEGLFPHTQAFFDMNEIEEERRLCYVGITRAMDKLFLTYSKRRLIFGQTTNNMMSRFIMELPKEVLEKNLIYNDEAPDYL